MILLLLVRSLFGCYRRQEDEENPLLESPPPSPPLQRPFIPSAKIPIGLEEETSNMGNHGRRSLVAPHRVDMVQDPQEDAVRQAQQIISCVLNIHP